MCVCVCVFVEMCVYEKFNSHVFVNFNTQE